jgi:hypothetical protein
VSRFREAMAPGSFLILSHVTSDDIDPQTLERLNAAIYHPMGATLRTRSEVERCFAGFDILEPGIAPADRWRPKGPVRMGRFWLWAGVGIKRDTA